MKYLILIIISHVDIHPYIIRFWLNHGNFVAYKANNFKYIVDLKKIILYTQVNIQKESIV